MADFLFKKFFFLSHAKNIRAKIVKVGRR